MTKVTNWPFTYYYALPWARGPAELQRRQLLLAGSLRIGQLAERRLRSYDEVRHQQESNHLLSHVRDQLFAIALQSSTRSLLTSDVHWLQPNAHAVRFFKGTHVHLLWDADVFTEEGFYGVAGSLAFSLYRARQPCLGLDVPRLLNAMLRQFWAQHNLELELTPRQRVEQILLTYNLVENWSAIVRFLDDAYLMVPVLQPAQWRSTLQVLHQHGLGPNDWDQLKRRVPFLVLSEQFEPVWALFQAELNQNAELRAQYNLPAREIRWLARVLSGLERLAIPAGFALLLWALFIEGVFHAGLLFDQHRALPLPVYLNRPDLEAHRYQAANWLALAYDALEALSWYESVDTTDLTLLSDTVLSFIVRLLESVSVQELPPGGVYRLDLLL